MAYLHVTKEHLSRQSVIGDSLELTEYNKRHKILMKRFSLRSYGREKSKNHFQEQKAQNEPAEAGYL